MNLFSQNSVIDISYPCVMGILNATPDSFSDGGMYNSVNKAIKHADLMINLGATIIDIGGESTRPGATKVSVEEELTRVIPVVEAIAKRFKIWISVDTSKPEVIYESALAGAHIINDVRSLTTPGSLEAAAKTNLLICLVHHGRPTSIKDTSMSYIHNVSDNNNILYDVNLFFSKNIERCHLAGIKKERLILDPGFGFGKNFVQNYKLLSQLSEFRHFGVPLLVGLSRKSMIGQLLNVKIEERMNGSIACAVIAGMQGANIIRAHDIKETVEAMKIVKEVLSAKKNNFFNKNSHD